MLTIAESMGSQWASRLATHATPVISKGAHAIIIEGPFACSTMKIDCSMWLPPKGNYYRGYVEILEDSLVVAKKNKLLDNVLNDVMFGVLSGLLKAKEHMRIESSEVATVELKPYKSETETCVITLNNGEQVVLKLPDSEGNTRSIQIALNRNF